MNIHISILKARCWNFLVQVFLISCLLVIANTGFAAIIKGKVVNLLTDAPLAEVEISNVHTGERMMTTAEGLFQIDVKKGDLIEFRAGGYEVARVRIKSDKVANFYYIQLKSAPTTIETQLNTDIFTAAVVDSIKRSELYLQALQHYKLTGFDIVQHPFDALSKRNRLIWEFQKNYEIWERDKFVDYVFNDRLIAQLTGLDAERIEEYKRLYRPSYESIRSMSEYEYYTFIKESVKDYNQRKNKQNTQEIPRRQYNHDR